MTRLNQTHIQETCQRLEEIDVVLHDCADTSLREIALKTIGGNGPGEAFVKRTTVSVVPITSGLGTISGFSETVSAIAAHVGFNARTTRTADVAGMVEAFESACGILVMADDHRFVAINTQMRSVVDNNRTTGESFAVLLSLMAGGVGGKACGIIGCGPVGTAAAARLSNMGASIILCDIDSNRVSRLSTTLEETTEAQIRSVDNVAALLQEATLIVDASPAGDIIDAPAVGAETMIVSPGVPHGLTAEAAARMGKRFYHDQLPLGVATMVLAAAANRFGTQATTSKTDSP